MIPALVFVATIVVLGIPSAMVFIPWTMITGNVMPLYNVSIFIVRVGYRLAGIRVVTEGREHVPEHTACIFMANHVSNLDPPALIPRIPGRTSAFMQALDHEDSRPGLPASELADSFPWIATAAWKVRRRASPRRGAFCQKGVHITTFVEGTRSRDGRLLPFKKGPFYLAMETGAPCIPVSIHGTETMMAKGSLRIRPGTAHIVFHAPVFPRDFSTREELIEAVRTAIASGLPEWMRCVETIVTALRLHTRVVAVAKQPLAHGVGVVAIRERTNLHMNQCRLRLAALRSPHSRAAAARPPARWRLPGAKQPQSAPSTRARETKPAAPGHSG